MARMTQMRLDAITGSVGALKPAGLATGAEASSFVAADLQDILKGYAQAIANIHGNAEFTAQEPGLHTQMTRIKGGDLKVQEVGGADRFVVNSGFGHVSGSGNYVFKGNYEHELHYEEGNASIRASVGGMKISAGDNQTVEIVGMGGAGKVDAWAGGGLKFSVAGTVVSSSVLTVMQDVRSENVGGVDGSLVFRDDMKQLRAFNDLKWDGANLLAPSVHVGDLTNTQVVFAGVNGNLTGSGEMTFGAGGLTLVKDLSARSGSFSGDLTVYGDLFVQGNTVSIEAQTLEVEDQNIVLGKVATPSDATADGGGITLLGATNKEIKWIDADDVWHMTDGLKVAGIVSGSALYSDVASAVFLKSEADGEVVAGSAADFGSLMAAQLIAGTGVSISETSGDITIAIGQAVGTSDVVEFAGITDSALNEGLVGASATGELRDATSADVGALLVAGTGVSVDAATAEISIGQAVGTADSVEFAGLTLTSFDSKLLWSNAGVVEAADLVSFVDGTAEQIIVTDDTDGTITLSLPYDISDASNTALVGFTATSILGALNELAAGGGGGKGKWAEILLADAASGEFTFASGPDWSDVGFDNSRVDIYLNGQMMKETSDYALSSSRTVTFTFGLKADDVVTARIN